MTLGYRKLRCSRCGRVIVDGDRVLDPSWPQPEHTNDQIGLQATGSLDESNRRKRKVAARLAPAVGGQHVSGRYGAHTVCFPVLLLLIYFVCTFFPIVFKWIPILGEIRIVLVAGAALLVSYLASFAKYTNRGIYRQLLIFVWMAFVAAMALSLINSYDRGLTLATLEVSLKYFVVFLVMIGVVDNERRLNLLISAFAGCGVGMAVMMNVNYLVLGNTFMESYRGMSIETGIFADPNDLAMLLNVTLPFLLFFWVEKQNRVMSIFGIINIVIAVMYTFSRGGFLGMSSVAIGFLLLTWKTKKVYFVLVLIFAVLFWFLAPSTYKERISTIEKETRIVEETKKYPGRLEAWIAVVREGFNNPIIGTGAGCSNYVAGKSMRDWHLIHNSFIQVFADMGLFGEFIFLMLLVLPFKKYKSLLKRKSTPLTKDLQRFRFILLGLAAFAITGLFLPQAYSPVLYTLSGFALVQAQLISKYSQAGAADVCLAMAKKSKRFPDSRSHFGKGGSLS